MTDKLIEKLLEMSSFFSLKLTTLPLSFFSYFALSLSFFLLLLLVIQNKCVRYWPDLHSTKEFEKLQVRNVEERPAQDHILRKLEVTRLDRVRKVLP